MATTSSSEPWLPPALDDVPEPPAALEVTPAPSGWELPELGARAAAAPRARTAIEDAYARGLEEGTRAGRASALDEVRPAAVALERIAAALDASAAEFARGRARDLEVLALAVARRLVQRELAADPGIVRDLVARALELMPADCEVELRIHPDDRAAAAELLPAGGATIALRWTDDPTLDRGDFVLDSPARLVDGRADVALRALMERLADA